MIAAMLAVIGAVFVTAETGEDAGETENWHLPFGERGFGFGGGAELTDEEQEEIDALITSLSEEGATDEEIREAVSELLDELGILDDRLDAAIEQTEERLEVLNRQDELRDQGYTWDEINEIISEEFDLEYPIGIGGGMMHGRGCHQEFGWGLEEFNTN